MRADPAPVLEVTAVQRTAVEAARRRCDLAPHCHDARVDRNIHRKRSGCALFTQGSRRYGEPR